MNPGELRHRITLQYPSGTKKLDGVEVPNYVDGATVWAAVEPLRSRELFAAQAEHSEITTRIRLRYLPGITSQWRIRVKISPTQNMTYEIIGQPIDINFAHRELHLMCKVVE